MTEDLIERLSANLKPVPRYAMQRLVIGGVLVGIAVSALLMLLWLGPRPDLSAAATGAVFWIKLAYTAALSLLALPAVLALGRPGWRIVWPWIGMVGVIVALAVAAWVQLSSAPPAIKPELVMGSTALICPFIILAIAAPVLTATLAALRKMAPTRPALAGFAAGLLAGGAGAWVYSFHCTEIGLFFLLTWYSLGVLVVAVTGAILGRFLLRW